jgi:hypothetical protein
MIGAPTCLFLLKLDMIMNIFNIKYILFIVIWTTLIVPDTASYIRG